MFNLIGFVIAFLILVCIVLLASLMVAAQNEQTWALVVVLAVCAPVFFIGIAVNKLLF